MHQLAHGYEMVRLHSVSYRDSLVRSKVYTVTSGCDRPAKRPVDCVENAPRKAIRFIQPKSVGGRAV